MYHRLSDRIELLTANVHRDYAEKLPPLFQPVHVHAPHSAEHLPHSALWECKRYAVRKEISKNDAEFEVGSTLETESSDVVRKIFFYRVMLGEK